MPDLLARLQASLEDRYAIEGELGRGGMAMVYLARDLRHGRQVALKVLRPELAAILGRERFLNEIRLTAQLDHPNILTLIDSGEADGLLYYVLPLVRGESLRDRLDREQQLGLDDAVRIATQVAAALECAHQRGVIHRDIKPENILLHEGVAMVADFGIALALREAGGARLTETGLSLGTPQYMSPEQATGSRQLDARSDVYSLAAVVYEMLAGEPPFSGPSAQSVIAKLLTQRPISVRALRDSVSPALDAAVLKALAKVPADRFATATAFAQALVSTERRRVQAGLVLWLALAMLAAGAVAAGAWHWRTPSPPPAVASREVAANAEVPFEAHSIAVLYFEDQSPRQVLGLLADGLTEGLISALGGVGELSVVSKGGVAQYRRGAVSRDSIARALGVDALIEGSVTSVADHFRVKVWLVAKSGATVGEARELEGTAHTIRSIQDSLVATVLTWLGKETGGPSSAWMLIQKARQARGRGDSLYQTGNPGGFTREYLVADSLAAGAETLDPTWPDPIVLRGVLSYWRSRRAVDDAGLAGKMIEAGLAHAERALALDKNDAEALALRGDLNYWRWLYPLEPPHSVRRSPDSAKRLHLLVGAESDLEKATQLDPSNAGAYGMLSQLYANVPGKTTVDVVRAARTALEKDAYLSSADVILNRLALGYYDLGQFPDADKWCREGARRYPTSPDFVECQLLLMTSTFTEPDPEKAWKLADSMVQLTKDEPDRRYAKLNGRVLVAGVLARAGRKDSARALLHNTKDDPEVDQSRDLAPTAAFAWTLVGDSTEALNQLKAYLVANPGRVADFREDPNWWFRELSNDPRYKTLVSAPR